MTQFGLSFVFVRHWKAIMVQTCSKMQMDSRSNHSFSFFCSQNFTTIRNKDRKKVSEAAHFGTTIVSTKRRSKQSMLVIFDFLHVKVSKSTGEFVLVDVLVFRDVFVGAVRPRAARRPPEKTLLLVKATTKTAENTISHFSLPGIDVKLYRVKCFKA